MSQQFRIGVSSSFKTVAPGTIEPILARLVDPLPHVEWQFFEEISGEPVLAGSIADVDGVIAMGGRYDASTVGGSERFACVARWGVGYDLVDTEALTANHVLLAIAVDAVRKPVAEAIVTLILALAKKLAAKDRLVRIGRWDLKSQVSGLGMSGKTVGSVGMGNIGGELFRLLGPFDLGRRIAHDPYLDPQRAEALDVELVGLEEVFSESDFVAINCPSERRNARFHRRPPIFADEADRLFHQYGARADRQTRGLGGGLAERRDRRRGPGCSRAGAAAAGSSADRDGQRGPLAARAGVDG